MDIGGRAAREYRAIVEEADRAIRPMLAAVDVEDLSGNNAGYRVSEEEKFVNLVTREKARFLKALSWIDRHLERGSICDLGCFVPYLPVCLALRGYRVTILDNYSLYGPSLKNAVRQVAEAYGIRVCDGDILADDLSSLGRFDAVLLMAVVEHLNGSPRKIMESVRQLLADDGFLLFEVPNIAEFCRRVKFLLGQSPLCNYANYFRSGYPFLGHNREMTVSEVRYLFAESGLEVRRLECYDYSNAPVVRLSGKVLRLLKKIVPMRNKRQSIMALGRSASPCRGKADRRTPHAIGETLVCR